MGMYDTIQDRLFCPFCSEPQGPNSFQTKDLSDMLHSWTIKDIARSPTDTKDVTIYTPCKRCKRWIQITLRIWDLQEELKEEITTKGFIT